MAITTKTKISLLLTTGYLLLAGVALAADVPGVVNNIIDHYGWSGGGGSGSSAGIGVVGWVDFGNSDPGSGEVEVTDTQLKGYANILQAGLMALDCATSPNGNICFTGGTGSSDFKVANDGAGNLSGWAWNDNIGWISFCGNDSSGSGATGGCPASPTYQVKIDSSSGDFSGWAWNDVIGWISFNCNNAGIGDQCSSSSYKVKTSWRVGPNPPFVGGGPTGIGPGGGGGGGGTEFDSDTYLVSSVYDTQVQGGAALNTLMWLGDQPTDTSVGIQIASSNSSSGPWTYVGPDGKSTSAYEVNQGVQFRLNPKDHNNKRYFRYKLYLKWVAGATPEVQDVVINYSP